MSDAMKDKVSDFARVANLALLAGVLITLFGMIWSMSDWHATTMAALANQDQRIKWLESHVSEMDVQRAERYRELTGALAVIQDHQVTTAALTGAMQGDIRELRVSIESIARQFAPEVEMRKGRETHP